MTVRSIPWYAVLITMTLLAVLVVSALQPAPVHATPLQLPLPGWLQDMLDQLEIALVKTLQDTARVGALARVRHIGERLGALRGDRVLVADGAITDRIAAVVDLVVFLRRTGRIRAVDEIAYVPGQLSGEVFTLQPLFEMGATGLHWSGSAPDDPRLESGRWAL